MNTRIHIHTLLAAALLAVSCDHDPLERDTAGEPVTLHLTPALSSFIEVAPWSELRSSGEYGLPWATRASYETTKLPQGYVFFETLHPNALPLYSTIGAFMTPTDADYVGSFEYQSDNDWTSTLSLLSEQQYYIYGFMPHYTGDGATITSLSGGSDYSSGAVITVPDFSTITNADVCAVAGLRKGADSEVITALADNVELGQFGFVPSATGRNTIFVLLRHLYASLRFRLNIDADYHQLRSIYVTKLELQALDIPSRGTLTITLTANDDGTDPVSSTFTPNTAEKDDYSITLYDAEVTAADYTQTSKPGLDLPEVRAENFIGCFAPGQCSAFRLKTTYDVYDRKGNLIRKQCTAENRLSISTLSAMTAGDVYTLHITVKPTFLYVLSDPDLDNPTFEINE